MERSLAHIEKVHNIRPIENADRIEQIGVLGWNLIAKKGEFKYGDLCVYIEIDSKVDETNENFAFLENKKYKVKSMKMRGVISQGLALPVSILKGKNYKLGQDVTSELKITKIEDDYKPTEQDSLSKLKQSKKKLLNNHAIKYFMRYSWFRKLMIMLFIPTKKKNGYPAWVTKTDETRVQNMPQILRNKNPLQVTEKLDGTSTTFTLKKSGKKKFNFIVCSRNMVVGDGTVYMEMAKKYDVENTLKALIGENEFITLQGETIGDGIQKNKYGLKDKAFFAFNLVTSGKGKIDSIEASKLLRQHGIDWCPIVSDSYILPDTIEELMEYSTGKSELNDTLREGYVFRDKNNTISFKCVSNEFLLKHNL